jgi:hypothetical protein
MKIYKTIILPVVLFGFETWFLTLREAHRVSVTENRVLRRICGPKREKVEGGWRRLHNEEPHNLHVARMGQMRIAYRNLVEKPEGTKPRGKFRRSWEHKMKMDLRERGWEGVDWILLAQKRNQKRLLVKTIMNSRVP